MEEDLLCVPITPAKSATISQCLNPTAPNCRIFGAEFGPIDLNDHPSSNGGECSSNFVFGAHENSSNSGCGDFVLETEKHSFVQLLKSAVSGALTGTGTAATPTPEEQCGGVPDDNGISVPPTPVEKEHVSKKKRQQKVKTKKHRPRIFYENKPKRIPKPKRESLKRKPVRKSSPGQPPGSAIALHPQTPKPLVEKSKRKRKDTRQPWKSCKRGINFNLENTVEGNMFVAEEVSAESNNIGEGEGEGNNYVSGSLDNIGKKIVDCAEQAKIESLNCLDLGLSSVQSKPNQNGGKEMNGATNQNGCQSNSLQVYRRTIRSKELVKNIRKFGPNCPSILKRKRTQRQRAIEYNFSFTNSKQKVTTSKYALRSNSKKHATFAIDHFNHLVLPTKSQIEAAFADPESFKCLFGLRSIVTSRRKRSKRSSLSTHSTPGNKSSSNVGKRFDRLMTRRDLPALNTIACSVSHGTETSKLPLCDHQLFDIKIQFGGDDNVLLKNMYPWEKYSKPLAVECHQKDAVIPATESSHAKVELKIHPSYLESPLPIALSTSGSQSKFKVETFCHQDRRLLDIECQPKENFVPTIESSHAKVKLLIHPPYLEYAIQEYLLPAAQSTSSSHSKFKVERPRRRHENTVSKMGSPIESIIQQLEKLQINKQLQLVVQDRNLHDSLGLHHLKKRPKVYLEPETIRMWNLLMEKDASELPEDTDEKTKTNWEEQRELFRKRVAVFINCMQILQGDRRFSPWKGSVVDSVVGVFLTQNVSDYLSSNAFMSLAAKFPATSINRDSPSCSQESTSNATGQQPHVTFPSEEESERVVENSPINHDFSCSSPGEHPIVTHEPSTSEKNDVLTETLEFEETVYFEQSAAGTRLHSCESCIITSSTNRLDKLNGAPDHNSCTASFQDNMGFECDFAEHINKNLAASEDANKNCGSKNGCFCVRGMLEEEASSTVPMYGTHVKENETVSQSTSKSREKRGKVTKIPKPDAYWEELRRTYFDSNRTPGRDLDSIDWDAVRRAPVKEIAKVIESRGMNNILAGKIQDFLNRLLKHHGSIDLEWLRDVPPDEAKEFLLSIRGVGLKSTECVRLLSLGHHAFPVDTNIARIAVRLGWVPLQPLPGGLHIHLLELYPSMDDIQKYLWPRLCTLDKNILYVLHYHLITFGKVICTKKNPNCNSCPLSRDCRHFASAFASSNFRLRDKDRDDGIPNSHTRQPMLMVPDIEDFPYGNKRYPQARKPAIEIPASPEAETTGGREIVIKDFPCELDEKSSPQPCEPFVEVPASPEPESMVSPQTCEPFVEVPASPEPESMVSIERDTNGTSYVVEDGDEIPHIRLETDQILDPEFKAEGLSNALVIFSNDATIPTPKIKSVERLRTKHLVYILPDYHELLYGFEPRERDDPCYYLLAIWPKEQIESSNKSREESCSQESVICDGDREDPPFYGTILIPCRTATKGRFPLNGTYFQVNEVFADHESSQHPIIVPTKLIWNLHQCNLYCGSTTSAIARGMNIIEIQHCFKKGYICVRAFDRRTHNPEHLATRFHELPSAAGKKKNIVNDD